MELQSRHRHHVIVVIPKDYEIVAGHKRLVRGLSAEFEDHLFDSYKAQKAHRWTDEQRIEVENFLMEHEEYGRGIYPATLEMPSKYAAPVQPDGTAIEPEREVAEAVEAIVLENDPFCIVTFATPQGAQRCQNRHVKGTSFCSVHQGYGAAREAEEVRV